jgi:hypothetical protein
MHPQNALLARHAYAQRKSIMSRAPMHVESITAQCPQTVIGDLRKGTDKRVWQAKHQQAELPSVCVSAENEVRFAIGNMTKCARIMQKNNSLVPLNARMALENALHPGRAIPEMKIDPQDLHGTRWCFHGAFFVDEQRGANVLHSSSDRFERFVIVVAQACENPTGKGIQRPKRSCE